MLAVAAAGAVVQAWAPAAVPARAVVLALAVVAVAVVGPVVVVVEAAGIRRGGGPILPQARPGGGGAPFRVPAHAARFAWRPDRPAPRDTCRLRAPSNARSRARRRRPRRQAAQATAKPHQALPRAHAPALRRACHHPNRATVQARPVHWPEPCPSPPKRAGLHGRKHGQSLGFQSRQRPAPADARKSLDHSLLPGQRRGGVR